jgi:hypothetical protein
MGKAKARKKILGLQQQVIAHELKLKNEPESRSAKHWRKEIANW